MAASNAAADPAGMDYSDTGNVVYLPDKSSQPSRLVFGVGFDMPEGYHKQILVILYKSVLNPRVLEDINKSAQSKLTTYLHGSVQYDVVCAVVRGPLIIPIFYRKMVTGGTNPNVIHEYYGLCRDINEVGNNLYKTLALKANRSAGEMLNSSFFSCIYEHLHFDEATNCLVPGKDPSDRTLTWLGIDYFGDKTRSFQQTRRLQEVVDGAFVFPRCVYTMCAMQSTRNLLNTRMYPGIVTPLNVLFNIVGQDTVTPLGYSPEITFISGYRSRELDRLVTHGADIPMNFIQMRNCHYINGVDGDSAKHSALDLQYEVGGVMIRRSTTDPGFLSLDSNPKCLEPTGVAVGSKGFYKVRGLEPTCEAPVVISNTPKESPAVPLDYTIHTHPIVCYKINKVGFGPPSGGDLRSLVNPNISTSVDGAIVFSFEGEWMYYVNPIVKHYARLDPNFAAFISTISVSDEWTTESRAGAVKLFKDGSLTSSIANKDLQRAVLSYSASIGRLITTHHGVTLPIFHCQYRSRVHMIGENVSFAVRE